MSETALDRLLAAQSAHVAALDAGAIGAIETTVAAMQAALAQVRATDAHAFQPELRDTLADALGAAEGAKARVHFHADRNRRRLDRLFALADAPRPHAYGRAGRLG